MWRVHSSIQLRRYRRLSLLLLAALPVAIWLVGVGVFRVITPRPSPAALSKPPAGLVTAADYLAQGDYAGCDPAAIPRFDY